MASLIDKINPQIASTNSGERVIFLSGDDLWKIKYIYDECKENIDTYCFSEKDFNEGLPTQNIVILGRKASDLEEKDDSSAQTQKTSMLMFKAGLTEDTLIPCSAGIASPTHTTEILSLSDVLKSANDLDADDLSQLGFKKNHFRRDGRSFDVIDIHGLKRLKNLYDLAIKTLTLAGNTGFAESFETIANEDFVKPSFNLAVENSKGKFTYYYNEDGSCETNPDMERLKADARRGKTLKEDHGCLYCLFRVAECFKRCFS